MTYFTTKDNERVYYIHGDAGHFPDEQGIKLNTITIWIKWSGSRWFNAGSIFNTRSSISLKSTLANITLDDLKEEITMYDARNSNLEIVPSIQG